MIYWMLTYKLYRNIPGPFSAKLTVADEILPKRITPSQKRFIQGTLMSPPKPLSPFGSGCHSQAGYIDSLVFLDVEELLPPSSGIDFLPISAAIIGEAACYCHAFIERVTTVQSNVEDVHCVLRSYCQVVSSCVLSWNDNVLVLKKVFSLNIITNWIDITYPWIINNFNGL